MRRFLILGVLGLGAAVGCNTSGSTDALSALDSAATSVAGATTTASTATERALSGLTAHAFGEWFLAGQNLTDEQKTALQDIHNRVESGEITPDEAKAEIEALLGVTLPDGFPPAFGFGHLDFGGGPFANLTADQQAALKDIHDRYEAGTITSDEAKAEIEALLGITLPADFTLDKGPFANLTDEQRAQLDDLRAQLEAGTITREEFRTQVEAIVGDLPDPPLFGGHGRGGRGPGGPFGGFGRHGFPADLTAEQQSAIDALVTQLQAGEITRDEFHKQVEAIINA